MNMLLALILFIISCGTWIAFWVCFAKWAEDKSAKGYITLALFLVSVALTIYWFLTWLPWFQPLFFHIFYTNAGFWFVSLIILGGAVIIGLLVAFLAEEKETGWKTGAILFCTCFVLWWIAYGIMGGAWTEKKLYESLTYEEIATLPDTTAVRYLPMEVAWRYGENRLQEPRIKHVDADPIVTNDEVRWILTRAPKGMWNEWLRNSDGFTVVDSKGDVSTIRQKMTFGEGMLGSDNILWKLRQQRYWSEVSEIYYVQGGNGEVVAVAPYINYSLKFPITVPSLDGVFLVHSSGTIEDLTLEQAQQHPLLKDIRIFPEKLAKLYVQAYAYKNGIGNAFFTHQDQIKIPSVSETVGGNEMPFLLPTEAGQKWFVAANPWGAEGIYRIFFVDAITGKIEFFSLPRDSALIGPKRAQGYITRAYPTFDWNQIMVLESRPIMREGILYWMFTLTPNNLAGIVDTVMVNSRTNEVLSLGSDFQKTLRFLRGEKVGTLVGIGETPVSSVGQVTSPTSAVQQTADLSSESIDQLIEELKKTINQLEELKGSLSKK